MTEEKKEQAPEKKAPQAEAKPAEQAVKQTEPAQTPAAEPAAQATAPAAASPAKEEKKAEVVKVKPENCAACNKSIKKKIYYYRNGKFYCNKRCWKTTVKKEEKPAEAGSPQQQSS